MRTRLAIRQPSSCLQQMRYITTRSLAPKTYIAPSAKQKTIVRRENILQFAFTSESRWAVENRSFLRAILRECTYLPDPNARIFMKFYALGRFRATAIKAHEHRDDPQFGDRLATQRKDTRKWLNRLRSANDGERKALRTILLYTYGRIGRRRYELMFPLMPTEGRQETERLLESDTKQRDDGSLESGQDAHSEQDDAPSQHEWKQTTLKRRRQGDAQIISDPLTELASQGQSAVPNLTPELLALASSQSRNNPPNSARTALKQLTPVIPTTNNRLLPMPKRRVNSMANQWYATLLDRILPPLPSAEWYELQSRALGEHDEDIVVRRRAGRVHNPDLHFGDHSALEAIVVQGRLDLKSFDNRASRKITRRFLQNMWAEIFSMCPLMTYDTERDRWLVTWGHQAMHKATAG